jgi:decaprenylphospho-beta-D-ribofuranose 2-oxidase
MNINGWGRYPNIEAQLLRPRDVEAVTKMVSQHQLIARGLGRSYGDSSLASVCLESTNLDCFLGFDKDQGIIRCQAGVSLRQVLEFAIPQGWFLAVTPGTSYVTVGGAIASDIHGKNHHLNGSFSDHVISMQLMLADGSVIEVSRDKQPDLFHATCGGMGLTGIILSATFTLIPIQSSMIEQKLVKAPSLEEVCSAFEEHADATYSVAWIDCLANGKNLGRSLLMLGEHSKSGDLWVSSKKPINIPVNLPTWILNSNSIGLFNQLYFHKAIFQKASSVIPYQPYFYPLDQLQNWNRLYGKNGFVQYQFVLPKTSGVSGLKKVVKMIADSGSGSFLAVLKLFGKGNSNFLSFPMEGFSLALDFKVNQPTLALLDRLDLVVQEMGGRVYLTKDARMSAQSFRIFYPQWQEFEEVRAKYGAIGKFQSLQSLRLGLQ